MPIQVRQLAELSKDVEFDVLDTADNVAAEVTGSNGAGDLDEANTVVVSDGDVMQPKRQRYSLYLRLQ